MKRKVESGILYRSFQIERAEKTCDDDRTIELSFSSESPIEQYNWDVGRYIEVLDHSKESVDLSRLRNSAPLLLEHNREQQIGVIEEARIDADKKGRAKVRFGKSDLANEIYEDVKDGIRRLVSVGYRIHKLVTEKVEDAGLQTMRAMSWTPMEISIVSVPADVTVGVGRGDRTDGNTVEIITEEKEQMKPTILREAQPNGGGSGIAEPPKPPPAPPAAEPGAIRQADLMEMAALARLHKQPDLLEDAFKRGIDLNQFRAEILNKIRGGDQNPGTSFRAPETPQKRDTRSLGELITESQEYRNRSKTREVKVGLDLPGLGVRATFLTTTGLTNYDRQPGIVLLEQQPLTIAQLFAQGETTAPTVRFVRETSYTNAATAVAEEGQKPEASFDVEEVDATVKKIAVLGRISDEMFADFPQMRDYVNQRLIFMVGSLEDNHLLNGDGTSNKITGVLATSGIQTEAAGASSTVADAIHKAITKVRSVGFFSPDAIVMHPNDWQDLRLSKDGNQQYYGGGPFGGAYGVGGYTANGPLWGLPVVVTTAIAEGTALVGAFKLGGQVFRREGIRVEMTNSDASDFAYNRICIRVEERLTLAVYRPKAFCTVTGIA